MSKSNATSETGIVNREATKRELSDECSNHGLFVRGYIQGRTRKFFETSEKFRFCYIFLFNGIRQLVYSWDSENVLPVGTVAEVPVIISSYSDRKNMVHTQITIKSRNTSFGEEEF